MLQNIFQRRPKGGLLLNAYRGGALSLKQISILIPSGASLIVTNYRDWQGYFKIICTVGNSRLDARFRYHAGEPPRFSAERLSVSGIGPLLADEALRALGPEPLIPLDAIEGIVARCYAHLRDDARRVDRARGYGLPYVSAILARRWRDAAESAFTLFPVPRDYPSQPDGPTPTPSERPGLAQ